MQKSCLGTRKIIPLSDISSTEVAPNTKLRTQIREHGRDSLVRVRLYITVIASSFQIRFILSKKNYGKRISFQVEI